MLRQFAVILVLVSICVTIHTVSMVLMGKWLINRRTLVARRNGFVVLIAILIAVFAIISTLHLIETAVWAWFFQLWELFPDFETSMYFSLKSYTTIGYGDVLLPQKWRLLGCIEGLTGVLLSGMSTAFLFVILNAAMPQFRNRERAAE